MVDCLLAQLLDHVFPLFIGFTLICNPYSNSIERWTARIHEGKQSKAWMLSASQDFDHVGLFVYWGKKTSYATLFSPTVAKAHTDTNIMQYVIVGCGTMK